MSARHRTTAGALVLALSTLGAAARAQPTPPPPPGAPAADDKDVEGKRQEARASFERGLALLEKEAWDAALAELLRSRQIYPTRAATEDAAFCLRQLRRLDEALEMFEELLKFSNLPEAKRRETLKAIEALGAQIGTLRIGGAEAGASIVVDGRYRGTAPLGAPLRMGVGIHEIRAFKEGQEPFGVTVEVKSRQEAAVELRSLSTGGRLEVTEQHQRVLVVMVDGRAAGKTPWQGTLPVGEHLVTLRGSIDLSALPECAPGNEDKAAKRGAPQGNVELGTQPVSVPIRLRETTKLTLTAEALDTSLRVEPAPGGASVAIDSVVVGRGAWEGWLRVGEHKVEVSADGFLTETRRVTLLPRKRQVLAVELERDRSTASFRTARNAGAGAAFAVGAVGLGVGIGTGLAALAKIHDVEAHCQGTRCPPSEQASVNAASTLGTISTIGLVIGGAGVVTGTVVLVGLRPGESRRRSGATSPGEGAGWTVGVGLGHLRVEGRF